MHCNKGGSQYSLALYMTGAGGGESLQPGGKSVQPLAIGVYRYMGESLYRMPRHQCPGSWSHPRL